jgi:hypothetical protein
VYQAGTLPNGEPIRSSGHWNLPTQVEVFETLAGRVLMLIGGHGPDGARYLIRRVCRPGDVVVTPLRAWHLTYVLDGPAVVFNIATESGDLAARQAGLQLPDKYRRALPPAVALQRSNAGCRFVGTEQALREWGVPVAPPDVAWPQPRLRPGQSLADFYLYGSAARLDQLLDEVWAADARGWPSR